MKAVGRLKDEEAALIRSGSSFRPSFSETALCTRIRELWFVKAGRFSPDWRTKPSCAFFRTCSAITAT